MREDSKPGSSPFALDRIPNGLIVLLTVSLLLQGPAGAVQTLWHYACGLLGTLLGGEELFVEVLCQTAPLSLAAGAIAFARRGQWLTFSSLGGLVAASMLILGGTWIGGELRSFSVNKRTLAKRDAPMTPAALRGQSSIILAGHQLPDLDDELSDVEIISVSQAVSRLCDVQSPATDGSHHSWTTRVPRVALLPEKNSAWGLLTRAINQLFGYFVIYRPRLFFAAILLGVYFGWSWQPHANSIRCWLLERKQISATAPS